jgi:hypothetical protein
LSARSQRSPATMPRSGSRSRNKSSQPSPTSQSRHRGDGSSAQNCRSASETGRQRWRYDRRRCRRASSQPVGPDAFQHRC